MSEFRYGLVGLLVLGATAQLLASDPFSGKVEGLTIVSLTHGPGQELVKSSRPNIFRVVKGPRLESLAQPPVIEQLELVPEQQEQLARLRVEEHRLKPLFKKLDFESLRDPMAVLEVIDEIVRKREAVEERIRDILLPHQLDRMQQLEARGRVIMMGIEPALHSTFQELLELTPNQIDEILQEVVRLREEVALETAGEWRTMMEGVGSVLTEAQRERWIRQFPDEEGYFVASLSLLAQQTILSSEPVPRYESFLEELFDSDSGFVLTSAGTVKRAESMEAAVTIPGIRLVEIAESRKYGELDLNRLVVGLRADDDDVRRGRELNEGRMRNFQRFARDEMTFDQLVEETFRVLKRHNLEQLLKVERQLDPDDLYQLELVVRRRLLTQHGLYQCLIVGTLGSALELSEQQAARIRELADQRHLALRTKCRDLENKIWDTVRTRLTPAQRAVFDKSFGPHPESIPGLPDVLLARATSPG